jgi:hypothetical protein
MLSIPASKFKIPGSMSINSDGENALITTKDTDGVVTRQRHPVTDSDQTHIAFSAAAAAWLNVIARNASGDLSFEPSEDGTTVQVKGGPSAATVRTDEDHTAIKLPDAPKLEDLIEVPTAALQSAIDGVAVASSTDPARVALQGVHINFGTEEAPQVTLRGTDSYRAASATVSPAGNLPELANALVFASQLKKASKLLTAPTSFVGVCPSGFLYMWDKNVSQYVPQLVESTYPEASLAKHETMERCHTVSVDTEEMIRVVQYLVQAYNALGSKDLNTTVVRLSQLDDGTVSLASHGVDHSVGAAEAVALQGASVTSPDGATFPGAPIDARYLLDAVKAAGGPSVDITVGSRNDGVLVKGESTTKHVIALHL